VRPAVRGQAASLHYRHRTARKLTSSPHVALLFLFGRGSGFSPPFRPKPQSLFQEFLLAGLVLLLRLPIALVLPRLCYCLIAPNLSDFPRGSLLAPRSDDFSLSGLKGTLLASSLPSLWTIVSLPCRIFFPPLRCMTVTLPTVMAGSLLVRYDPRQKSYTTFC